MDSIDLAHDERRARFRYEWARLWRALVGFAPVWIIVIVTAVLARHPVATIALGLGTFIGGAALLWYGRDLKRAVLPGVATGLIPLSFVLCATHLHACMGDGCLTVCVPVCSIGGVIAGVAIASIANRRRAGFGFWLGASGLALLTGAMGCSCVGVSGVLGLVAGYAAGGIGWRVKK